MVVLGKGDMSIKVLGAGFGRTGTKSLKVALEILGFGPCYHMYEVTRDQVNIWKEAIDGEQINWSDLFKKYQSAVDWPTISFTYQLLKEYPHAKVILTLRDPEDWFESASSTIFAAMVIADKNPNIIGRQITDMARHLILENVFSGRYDDKEYCIEVYNQHVQQIVGLVPPDKLLKYHISDGWQPLCEFLSVPVPCNTFPKENDREKFPSLIQEWVKQS